MRKGLFPAIFLIVFMVVFSIMALVYLPSAISKTENPTLKSIMIGTWGPNFEASLNESFPIFDSIRDFWGRFEYDVFGEGRKGVVVGDDGWLFTDEEFSCVKGGVLNTDHNLSYISDISLVMGDRDVKLVVVLVPSKARVYKEYLGKFVVPACRKDLYSRVMVHLRGSDIPVVSGLDVFNKDAGQDNVFLKTDTHWTPHGAQVIAHEVANSIDVSAFSAVAFSTVEGDVGEHDGDLLRYLPGVKNEVIKTDMLPVYDTQKLESNSGEDVASALFSDTVVPVTLVGTSYSANSKWNFHGFLKDAMDVDILNMADEGLGPFAVMETYLSGDTWKNSPPSVVIWEIPERYITAPFEKKKP